MLTKRKAALGNAAGNRLDGLALPSLTFATIPQPAPAVKSHSWLSRELDRAIVGVETTTGCVQRAWRVYKRWLESQIGAEQ